MLGDVVEQDSDVGTRRRRRPGGCAHRRAARRGRRRRRSRRGRADRPRPTTPAVPVRSWNCPGRRRAARRSGNPASSSRPVASGSTVLVSNRTPARLARSLARATNRRTAPRSARSSDVCPATRATRRREVGGKLADPSTQHVAFVDDRGDDAGRRRRGGRHDPGEARVQRQSDHRAARSPSGSRLHRWPRGRGAAPPPPSMPEPEAGRERRGSRPAYPTRRPPARGRRDRRRRSRRRGAPGGCRARSSTTAGRRPLARSALPGRRAGRPSRG